MSIFDPKHQELDITSKIVAGLERISEVFKVLLWEKVKKVGLSPIQIQILIFISFHDRDLCNVSHLAKEFNVTKPTISDAVKILFKKGLVDKDSSPTDSRSYNILLTEYGNQMVLETHEFANPLKSQLEDMHDENLQDLFQMVSKLIYGLNKNGILVVQRVCYGCKFYHTQHGGHYCKLLKKPLLHSEIRLDCPEYEAR